MNRLLQSLMKVMPVVGAARAEQPVAAAPSDSAQLQRMSASFTPVDSTAQAGKRMDALFMLQVWAGVEHQEALARAAHR